MKDGFPSRKDRESSNNPRTLIVSFHIPRALLDALDRLVEAGVFNNRSEAIRHALYRLLLESKGLEERKLLVVGYR